uniref:BTB domain-containing protein n=1 Tax=Strigamia maritima TaxID=126957 RepID=T1IYU0_STRMM
MPKTFILEKFINNKSVNGYGLNRCFTFDRQTQHPSKIYANEILFRNELNKLRLDNLYTDVKLSCRGKDFGAHKFILASMCEFFHEIFVVRPVFERKSLNTVDLNELEPCVLEALLSFIYTGEMELGNFSVCHLNSLVKTSTTWKLGAVERTVLDHLMKTLNETNFNYALQIAIRLDDKDSEEKILTFLCDNIEAVWVPAEFADMNEPHLHQIFNNVSETLRCHDNLLRILLTWVNFNPEERRTNLNRLLSFVNFEKITITLATVLLQGKFFIGCGESRFLKEELRNKIVAFSEIKETVMPCEWQGIMNEELKKAINIVPSLDLSAGRDQFIIVVGRDESNRVVFVKYNFMLNEWGDLQDTGASLEDNPGITIYQDKIFLLVAKIFVAIN